MLKLFEMDWDDSQSEFRQVLKSSVMTPLNAMSEEKRKLFEVLSR